MIFCFESNGSIAINDGKQPLLLDKRQKYLDEKPKFPKAKGLTLT